MITETINYGGVFGQVEYSNDKFSTFFQGAVSNQSHQRFDYYDYQDQYQDSKKVNNVGFNVKRELLIILTSNMLYMVMQDTIHVNHINDNIYLNFTNEVNPLTENEKSFRIRSRYTFKSKIFTASVNAYRTTWEDRVVTTSTVYLQILQLVLRI